MNIRNKPAGRQPHFIRYSDVYELYGIGRTTAQKMVKEAGAELHVGRMVFIDPELLDKYIRSGGKSLAHAEGKDVTLISHDDAMKEA